MNEFQELKQRAKALYDAGDYSIAVTVFQQALSHVEDDLDILIAVGLSYVKLQDSDNAKHWLKRAEQFADSKAKQLPAIGYFYLGRICQEENNTEEAIAYFQSAVAAHPDFVPAHLMLAGMHMSLHELDDAEYHYMQAIRIQPDNADAHANLAQVYELLSKTEEARSSISRAFSIKGDHLGAMLALAKVEKREKNYQQAEQALRAILDRNSDISVTAMAAVELAQVLDKQKKYDEAFDSAEKGKQIWLQSLRGLPFDENEYQVRIKDNTAFFTGEEFIGSQDKVNSQSPVFFVGFPRSGTTLTEQILNQHTKVVTSDEKPFIGAVIKKIPSLLNTHQPYPECLSQLTADHIDKLRKVYWDAVRDDLPELQEDTILIDKLPLNIIEMGLINMLFPDAHILVALRDPRDTCLSAFMQPFTPNPAMVNFLSMEKTVNFYHSVMGMWLHYRNALNLKYYEYRYEDLVTEFDSTTMAIFDFLDLEYPSNVAEYHQSVSGRSITTPSYQDVSIPIYHRSNARWRNYEAKLEPYLRALMPYIEYFGYPVSK